jgi:L-ascorbate metabolism protein UlaG (beta-lactamase superfamily)
MKKIILCTFNRIIIFLVLFLFVITAIQYAQAPVPAIKIHYLGHSSFVLEFDNGVTVVTDYGEFNAWVQWGWDSPIYDFGNLVPDVMTYSHTHHADHYDPNRIPSGVDFILTENDSLELNGLKIKPIRVCESNLTIEDNSAFFFQYNGLKILHLGDAQIQIINIMDPGVKAHIRSIMPDSLDLLFMTIEGQQQFIPEAEMFIDLLQPKRVIPMHYWSEAYRNNFLSYLESQNDSGKNYNIIELQNEKYDLYKDELVIPIKVVVPQRGPFSQAVNVKGTNNKPDGFRLNQNYPNPFNPITTIEFSIPEHNFVTLKVFDMLGNDICSLVKEEKIPGRYHVNFDGDTFSSGIYFYKLYAGSFTETKKFILMK